MSSEPGAGSRFVIWLPEAKTTPTQTSTGESIPVHRALVVDDDPKVTEILFEILQELGMDVTCCQSGEATVALMEHSTQPIPDIAVVDIRLGAMDGIELGHRLLHHYGFTAILLISGDEPGPHCGSVRRPTGGFCTEAPHRRTTVEIAAVSTLETTAKTKLNIP